MNFNDVRLKKSSSSIEALILKMESSLSLIFVPSELRNLDCHGFYLQIQEKIKMAFNEIDSTQVVGMFQRLRKLKIYDTRLDAFMCTLESLKEIQPIEHTLLREMQLLFSQAWSTIDKSSLSNMLKLFSKLKKNDKSDIEMLFILMLTEALLTNAEQMFTGTKYGLNLVFSPKQDTVTKHISFWLKTFNHLLDTYKLKKHLKSRVLKQASIQILRPKSERERILKIREFCILYLDLSDAVIKEDEENVKKLKGIIALIPKGINILEEGKEKLWDTVKVRNTNNSRAHLEPTFACWPKRN